ncbi:MAG: HEAT repeat domain-containing protein [Anaerolineae bacterium]|nr:HEAT repeat domain-containing protein [Anaerolineae bacterium]
MADHLTEVKALLAQWTQAGADHERLAVSNAVIRLGEAAIKPLIETLDDPDPGTRRGAIRLLAALGKANVGEACAAAMEPIMHCLMVDTDGGVRAEAAGVMWIARRGEPYRKASDALITALGDDEPLVRKQAALALAKKMELSATDPLALLIETDRVPDVRGAAAAALAHLDYGAIQNLGEPAIAALLGELEAPEVPPTYSIRALGMMRVTRAIEPLLALLQTDERPRTRLEACKALGSIGDPRAVEVLRTIADRDPDDGVRSVAAEALARLAG